MTDTERLEMMEGALRALRDQVQVLRAEVAELRVSGASGELGAEGTAASVDASVGGPPRQHHAMDALPVPHPIAAAGTIRPPAPGAPPRQHDGDARPADHHPGAAARIPAPHPPRSTLANAARGVHHGRGGAWLENLVGRYGTLALATLAILMGVGGFVKLAIANAQLGPELRVGLGVLLALATAILGGWLRRRGTVRFGNTMLGLALAIVHVDAWGAGPNLGLVPPAAALAMAALASAALAALAWRSDEETLFAVGAGGALLAPFVTGGGSSRATVLLAYGWVVAAMAMAALRGRRWPLAARMLTFAIAAYTTAGIATAGGGSLAERLAAPAYAIACALTALALAAGPHRRTIARIALAAAVAALLAASFDVGSPRIDRSIVVLGAAAIAAAAYLALFRDDERAVAYWPADAVLIPLAALGVALLSLPSVVGREGALLALAWGAAAATIAARTRRRLPAYFGPNALTAALAAGTAIVLAARPESAAAILLLAAFAPIVGYLERRLDVDLLIAPALLALAIASGWAYEQLLERPAFAYAPFMTAASALALAVVAGWWLWARLAAPTRDGAEQDARRVYFVPAALVTFWWGRTEVAGAGSLELGSFLLTLYYAASGVLSILVGRLRAAPAARHAGLALAVFAALRALIGASDLRQVQLRIGSYLLVGAFLLAVAYWYRAAGDAEPDADPVPPPLPNE